MIKYFCDCCGKIIPPPSPVSVRAICTIEIIDPTSGKQESKMACPDCTTKVKEMITKMQKDNGVYEISKDYNLSLKK